MNKKVFVVLSVDDGFWVTVENVFFSREEAQKYVNTLLEEDDEGFFEFAIKESILV